MKNRLNPFLGTLAVIAMTQTAHATSDIWDGSQNTGTWSDAANWSTTPVTVPGTGDTATFNGVGGSNDTIDLGAGVTIKDILFNTSSVAAYTIGSGTVGSQTLTLNNSGTITANSTINANQLFNTKLVLGTDGTDQTYAITNNDAENLLTFAGGITGFGAPGTGGAKTLNVSTGLLANGGITLSGAITNGGASSLALAFAPVSGNVQINMGNAGNTYSGGTSVAANVRLHINAGAGAGLGTGDVTVAAGGQVYLNSAGTYTNNFAISGTKWGTESTALGAIRIGNGTTTLTGDVTLNANASIGVDSGRAATITGDITGAYNLDKTSSAAGTGSPLTLTGTNDYGTTTITRGVISFAKQASLYNFNTSKWTKSFIDVESGAGLALGVGDSVSGYWDAAGVTAFLGASQMGGSSTTDGFKTGSLIGFDTTNATDGTFTYGAIGNITLTNGVVKLGTGTLILNGVNTYTGPTAVEGGTLTLTNANPLTTGATSVSTGTLSLTDANAVQSSAVTLKNGATLQLRNNSATTFNSSGAVILNSVSAQTVTLDVGNNGSGTDNTLALANGISYAGPASILAGTYTTQINVTGANGYALSLPSVTFGNAASYGSGSNRNFILSLNPTSANVSIGDVTLTGSGSRVIVTLTLDGISFGNEITGAIVMPAGRPLTKSGSGTWTLSGTNTYTGATTVSAGTLAIDGNQSASTGNVGVSGTGTRLIGNNGTVGGNTTINSGAIHSAGGAIANTDKVGKQTFDQAGASTTNLSYGAGSIFEWDLNAKADTNSSGIRGTNYDAVDVTGTLTADSNAIFRVVLGTGATTGDLSFWQQTQTWSDIFGGGFSLSGSGFDSSLLQVVDAATGNTFDVSNLYSGVGSGFSISGTSLTWTAVPEPTSALAGLLITAGLLRRRRA